MGVFKKNGKFYIDYYENGRRKREMIGESRQLAEKVLYKRKVQIAENRYLDIKKNAKIKFEEFSKTYLELHSKPNKKSWKSDVFHIKKLCSYFGHRFLYDITPIMIERFKNHRREKVSAATVNRELACLSNIFTKAIEWDKIDTNPVHKVKFLKEPKGRLRYLEKEEIQKLLNVASNYLRPILILALNTGMRRSEILGLKWHNVDIRKGIIYLLDTKNNENREVPLNDLVKKTLIKIPKHPDSPYIFCKKDGRPIKDVRKSFNAALKKVGITNFRFHDLRHTFASQLAMAGIDLNTIRELMGHKSLAMTLRYSHLSPSHKTRAVEILQRQINGNYASRDQNVVPIWTPKEKRQIREKRLLLQPIGNKRS